MNERLQLNMLKITHIHIAELGLNGLVTLNRNWFLKAEANFGTVTSGDYTEKIIRMSTEELTGKTNQGYSQNTSVGLGGYLFPVIQNLRVGPVGGWSYDYLGLIVNHSRRDGNPYPFLNRLNYSMTWRGPWTGVTSEFSYGRLGLAVGYEYHWGNWKSRWKLDREDQAGDGFSERGISHHAYGELVYGRLFISLTDRWLLDFYSSYQIWKAKEGKSIFLYSRPEMRDIAHQLIRKIRWESLVFRLGANYTF